MSKEGKVDINSTEMEMSATKFLWEENFDLKSLEFFGIIVNTSKKSVYCNYCSCFLPELSCSKISNINNIKLHVICNSHKLHSLIYSKKLHPQSTLSAVNHEDVETTMPSNYIKMTKSQLNVLINLDCKKLSGENTEWLSSAIRKLINTNFKGILDNTCDFQLNHTLLTIKDNQNYCHLCNCEVSGKLKFVLCHLQGRNHSKLVVSFLDEKNPLCRFFIPRSNTDCQLSINEIKQIFETFKENDLLNKFLISIACNNQLDTKNNDQVFLMIEEKLNKIDYIKQSDFKLFEMHRNLILFTNSMIRGYCKVCEKYFSSKKSCFHYHNLLEHICSKKHRNKFKKSLSDNESKVEYNILIWLRKQMKTNCLWTDKNQFNKFFDMNQIHADSQHNIKAVKQNLESFKLSKFFNNAPQVDEYKNEFCKKNIDVIFQVIEENLRKINYIKQTDFNTFEIHRNLILFTDSMVKGYCKMCEKYFPSTKNRIHYFNLMLHICGNKHSNKLKKSLSDYESKTEYKILVWLKDQIKKKEKNICTYLF